jgi:DNA-binding CsgD family transcriptional regulator
MTQRTPFGRMPLIRTVVLYALALVAGVFVLEWIEYRYLTRAFSTEITIGLIALGFTALGAWVGVRLTRRTRVARMPFERNQAAIAALGLTPRECEILERLASGKSLKELAREFGVSPNTVKTHVARVYQKLDVQRRMTAVERARALAIIA